MTDDIRAQSQALVEALEAAGKTVTAAESCTGGWIAKALTDIPGSSAVFAYGFVSYSNDAKQSLLDVPPDAHGEHGAVSEAVVLAMARGALERSGADLAVAVSGIAGPDGGSDDKPVGTVWFAWAIREGDNVQISADRRVFGGDREAVRRQTVLHAIGGLQESLKKI